MSVPLESEKRITHHASRPALVVFQGGAQSSFSALERLVLAAQSAATLDVLDRAAESWAFSQALLVSEDAALVEAARGATAGWSVGYSREQVMALNIASQSGEDFHFGELLQAVLREFSLERVVYVGGGAMPLASPLELRDIAAVASGVGECVAANNLYSADIVAFWPVSALEKIPLPATDNDLAWLLHYRAGLPFAPLPRTLSTQFDIDTPADLAALWWYAAGSGQGKYPGERLNALLADLPPTMPRLVDNIQRAYQVMSTRRAEVLVAGRVSSWVWRRLETNLPCQTRIFSEERGMRASGREDRGEVRSLLGLYSDVVGTEGLISALEQVCQAAFIDTRVLFAHRRLSVSRPDRFASDALMPDAVSDPWVRELTEAVVSAKIPIVLGGHSLVSGGLWALSERVRASASASAG
jgi:hypothetical protein